VTTIDSDSSISLERVEMGRANSSRVDTSEMSRTRISIAQSHSIHKSAPLEKLEVQAQARLRKCRGL
jgi:hypothetical protein